MTRKKSWTIACATFVMSIAAAGQTNVTPPPKPADSGPSLEETLKFISDRIAALGAVSYSEVVQNANNGNSIEKTINVTFGPASYSTSGCLVIYYVQQTPVEGQPPTPKEAVAVVLREVLDVVAMSGERKGTEDFSLSGHPEFVVPKTTPSVIALRVRRQNKPGENEFIFTDAGIANRVAKAITHAAELCGGGGKEPF